MRAPYGQGLASLGLELVALVHAHDAAAAAARMPQNRLNGLQTYPLALQAGSDAAAEIMDAPCRQRCGQTPLQHGLVVGEVGERAAPGCADHELACVWQLRQYAHGQRR